jgi:hypothetical protein
MARCPVPRLVFRPVRLKEVAANKNGPWIGAILHDLLLGRSTPNASATYRYQAGYLYTCTVPTLGSPKHAGWHTAYWHQLVKNGLGNP